MIASGVKSSISPARTALTIEGEKPETNAVPFLSNFTGALS
jgi:hypothetical protein